MRELGYEVTGPVSMVQSGLSHSASEYTLII
jgi:hypothetical protein